MAHVAVCLHYSTHSPSICRLLVVENLGSKYKYAVESHFYRCNMFFLSCCPPQILTAIFRLSQVFVSGPSGMVDSVMTHARMVDWKMFDVEASSREL